MTGRRHELILPDLGLAAGVIVSLWLVEPGAEVSEGDRLLEVLAGNATVDLPALASGILTEQHVCEGQPIQVGQVLGVIVEE